MSEKYRKYVYCDINFLKKFIYPDTNINYNIENLSSAELVLAIRRLIFNPYIVLYLNSRNEVNAILEDIDRKKKEAAKRGESVTLSPFERVMQELDFAACEERIKLIYLEVNSLDELLKLSENDPLWLDAILLSSNEISSDDIQLIEKKGLLIINEKTLYKCKSLIPDNGIAVKKDNIIDWNDCIKVSNVPCNTAIVIDNYVLNDTTSFDNNIRPILNAILPEQLMEGIVFQLIFFTCLSQNKGDKMNPLDPKYRIEKLFEILSQIRPKLDFTVTVFKCKKDSFHDRCIITNNLWISSGAGFDILKGHKSNKHTVISVLHPFLSIHTEWVSEAISNIIGEVRKIGRKETAELGKNNINFSFPTFYIGTRDLRIFSK